MKQAIHSIISVFILVSLTACSTNKDYPGILTEDPLAITVNLKDMTLSFVDMDSLEPVQEWKMKKPYTGGIMFPDGDTLLLYGKQLKTVDLYSIRKGELISSWDTGNGIVSGELLQNNKEIVFADQHIHAIRFFNMDGIETDTIMTEKNPLTILEGKEKGKLIVISFSGEKMTVLDLRKREIVKSFQIHSSAAGALFRESENELWIGGHGEGLEVEKNIHIYDSETGELKDTISAPTMPINFVEKDGNVFALSHGSNTLYKISNSGQVIGKVETGANPFEMKVFGDSIIIAGYDSNDLHIVDPHTLKVEKRIPVGKGPFQIILRERRTSE